MAVTSALKWYTNDKTLDLKNILRKLPELIGCSEIELVGKASGLPKNPHQDIDWEVAAEELKVTDGCLEKFFTENTVLQIDTDNSDLGKRLKAIQTKVASPQIRGDCILNRLSVTVGKGFVLLETGKYENFRVCFTIWGYSTPRDCPEFERLLSNASDFHRERVLIEHLLGSVKQHFLFG